MIEPGSEDALPDGIALDDFRPFGVRAVLTTRSGGVSTGPYGSLNLGDHVGDDPSSVEENRSRLARAMGVSLDALVIANQVHGARVAVLRRGDAPGDADALVTTDATIAICVLVADCVPIVLVDPVARVLGVVHAGWRGVSAQTPVAALSAAVGLGAEPGRCRAYIGPCISAVRYQVGEEVAAAFRSVNCGDEVVDDVDGRFRVDLAGACVRQLVAAGVPASHVTRSSLVTDGGDRFFSDRAHRPCGRFAIAARLEVAAS